MCGGKLTGRHEDLRKTDFNSSDFDGVPPYATDVPNCKQFARKVVLWHLKEPICSFSPEGDAIGGEIAEAAPKPLAAWMAVRYDGEAAVCP